MLDRRLSITTDIFLGTLQGSEVPTARRQRLHLTDEDRKTGLHVIGAPKTGKSKFLEHLIRQDIRNGQGLCVIDPHGSLYDDVLEWCAYVRPIRKIIPLNLSRGEYIIGFNSFIRQPGDTSAQAERNLDAAIKAWGALNTDGTPRVERVMTAIFEALIEQQDLTLLEAIYFISYAERDMREFLISRVESQIALSNLREIQGAKNVTEFLGLVESVKSRIERFLRAQSTRRFLALTDPAANLDIRRLMDEGAILLVNLKRRPGGLTRSNQRLIGTLLVNAFVDAALTRDLSPKPRPFHLYLDEFQNFVSADIGEAVTQVRKFGLTFVLAHQTLSQVQNEGADILPELFGAVKARAVFGGLSSKDAAELAPEIFPGQIDFREVKYMRETVKFWPVYDREKVLTDGSAHTDGRGRSHTEMESATELQSHTVGVGTGSATGGANTSTFSAGSSVPYFNGFSTPGGGMSFDSGGWGQISSNMDSTSSTSADSTGNANTRGVADSVAESAADSISHAEADIPVYRPIAYVEPQPEHYTLEEQRQRLADLLMRQYQRHCFVRPPDDEARPLLVPLVERFKLDEYIVRDYEAIKAKQAGALPPEEVDRIIEERQRVLKESARAFLAGGRASAVESDEPHDHEPAIKLNPPRRKKTAT